MTNELTTQSAADKDLATTETLVDWEKELQILAKEQSASVTSSSPILSTKNKLFSLGGSNLGTEIDVVIVDSKKEHAYYDRPYDPDNPTCPTCFAIEDENGEMYPHPTSPELQAEACNECPHNEFESAAVGKGKACKNSRRLALLAYGAEGLDAGELAILKLPPTSLKNFGKYVKTITSALKRPTFAVVTKLCFDPMVQYPVVVPTLENPIKEPAELRAIMSTRDTALEMLNAPYDVSGYEKYVAPERKAPAKAAKPAAAAAGKKSKMS